MAKAKKSCHKYFNANPNKIEVGDCVFRAIAFATGETWLEVYDELCVLGRKKFASPNDNTIYQPYLDERYPRVQVMYTDKRGKKKRHTAATLAKANPTGTFILRTAHHLTVLKDGVNYDTWDASECASYIIWKISD